MRPDDLSGRELDAAVARDVFGLKFEERASGGSTGRDFFYQDQGGWVRVADYSSNPSATNQVELKLQERGWKRLGKSIPQGRLQQVQIVLQHREGQKVEAKGSLEAAFCRAALKALAPLIEGQPDEPSPRGIGLKVIAAVLTVLAGATGWYLKGCVTDERQAFRETSESWTSAKVITQKLIESKRATSVFKGTFYDRLVHQNPTTGWIDSSRKQLIVMLDADYATCNEERAALNTFDLRLRALSHWFPEHRDELLDPTLLSKINCSPDLDAADTLRAANFDSIANANGPRRRQLISMVSAEAEIQILNYFREAVRARNARVEFDLSEIEGKSMWELIKACIRTSFGSSKPNL